MSASLRSLTSLTDPTASAQATSAAAAEAPDRAEFTLVYREFAAPIYRYCYRCLGSKEDAEDATAQVFTKALVHFHSRRDDNVRPWLYRIAHNVVIDMIRRRRPVTSFESDRHDQRVDSDVEAEFEQRELRLTLEQALAALSERDRQLVYLRLDGLSGAEVAIALNCSEGAMRVAHHRAIDRLRTMLMEQGHDDSQIS